jgi:hypothetical protein
MAALSVFDRSYEPTESVPPTRALLSYEELDLLLVPERPFLILTFFISIKSDFKIRMAFPASSIPIDGEPIRRLDANVIGSAFEDDFDPGRSAIRADPADRLSGNVIGHQRVSPRTENMMLPTPLNQ